MSSVSPIEQQQQVSVSPIEQQQQVSVSPIEQQQVSVSPIEQQQQWLQGLVTQQEGVDGRSVSPIANNLEADSGTVHGFMSDEQDHTCPICLELLLRPVQLSCSHRFCRGCWARVLQGRDVRATAHLTGSVACPYRCEVRPVVPEVDEARASQLESHFAARYSKRASSTSLPDEERMRHAAHHLAPGCTRSQALRTQPGSHGRTAAFQTALSGSKAPLVAPSRGAAQVPGEPALAGQSSELWRHQDGAFRQAARACAAPSRAPCGRRRESRARRAASSA